MKGIGLKTKKNSRRSPYCSVFAFDFIDKTGMLHDRKNHANKNHNSNNICTISKNFMFYIGSICFGVSDQR
jgi:hypothetical protein